jgi:hypothetical protein
LQQKLQKENYKKSQQGKRRELTQYDNSYSQRNMYYLLQKTI